MVFNSVAYLNPRDRYNRSTGRKVALARVLTLIGITRASPLRKLFFETYHAMRGKW